MDSSITRRDFIKGAATAGMALVVGLNAKGVLAIGSERSELNPFVKISEDGVVTNSGILGKIAKLDGEYLVLEVSDKIELKFQRSAIHAVLPKGTIKAI